MACATSPHWFTLDWLIIGGECKASAGSSVEEKPIMEPATTLDVANRYHVVRWSRSVP